MKIHDGRSAFYQWDVGQKLTSPTLSAGDEVHFYNVTLPGALVVKAYAFDDGTIVADVPNILLQKPLVITAYRYVTNADASSTRLEAVFDVIKRAKPDNYIYTPTEIFDVKKAVDAAILEAKEEGGFNGDDGLTPFIGENGNWWIGEEDTGVKAQGEDGTPGKDGLNGKDGADGKDYVITEADRAEIKAYLDEQIEPLREDINGAEEMLSLINEGGLE